MAREDETARGGRAPRSPGTTARPPRPS